METLLSPALSSRRGRRGSRNWGVTTQGDARCARLPRAVFTMPLRGAEVRRSNAPKYYFRAISPNFMNGTPKLNSEAITPAVHLEFIQNQLENVRSEEH